MNAAKTPLATGLLFLLLLSGCRYSENYKVYAVKYCAGWRIGAADVITGAAPSDSVDVCNMFWLLKSRAGKNILVDAGFIDSSGLNRNYVRPDSVLMRMNILPGAVSDIILTHPHQDHIGGITLFPNATIWMQRRIMIILPVRHGLKEDIQKASARLMLQISRRRNARGG